MSGLLVSVRDAEEARAALAGGATIIDVKEPSRGSLGAADPGAMRAVAEAIGNAVPLSAALGELCQQPPVDTAALTSYAFAKFGLSNCGQDRAWSQQWQIAQQALPNAVSLVAVAYADWQACAAPNPSEVIKTAANANCPVVLLDTFDKTQGDLLAHINQHQLADFIQQIRQCQMRSAIAGGLTIDTIARLLPLQPDWFAVRGAACGGQRTHRISTQCVRNLAELIQG